MLQAYKTSTYIIVDGEKQWMSFDTKVILVENSNLEIIEEVYTFDEIIKNNATGLSYIVVGKNWLFKRPYVKIQYSWGNETLYYHFNTLTVEKHYKPYDLTMNELFDSFPADKCIQYLKERGMAACPILK
jgi:hypothetical protein